MTTEITSTSNPRVRAARSLHEAAERRRRREYFIEGIRLVEEALSAGVEPREIFVVPSVLTGGERGAALLAHVASRATVVSAHVITHIAGTVTPQGIIATLPLPDEPSVASAEFLVILDGLADPGNAGTILRTVVASGLATTVVAVGGVDLFAPKVVRAAMGAHFRLALGRLAWPDLARTAAGRRLALADVAGDQTVWDANWQSVDGLIVASEAHGPSDEARQLASALVSIPMAPLAESLNASVAAGIILFEAARQRGVLR